MNKKFIVRCYSTVTHLAVIEAENEEDVEDYLHHLEYELPQSLSEFFIEESGFEQIDLEEIHDIEGLTLPIFKAEVKANDD